MKRLCTYKTLILNSFAFAAMLTVQSGHADQIRASFERDMQRGFTHSDERSSVSAAATDRSNHRNATSRKTNRIPTVTGYADQIRASFERDMQRGSTHSDERSSVSAAATGRSNHRNATSRKTNRNPRVNGSDLIGWCQAPASPYCKGYLLAVADSQQYYRNLCLPENITVREMGQVFVTWAEENSALVEKQAVVLLDIAYKQEWSCS